MDMIDITRSGATLTLSPTECLWLATALHAALDNDVNDFNATAESVSRTSSMAACFEAAAFGSFAFEMMYPERSPQLTLAKVRTGRLWTTAEEEAQEAARQQAERLVMMLEGTKAARAVEALTQLDEEPPARASSKEEAAP